MLGKKEGEGKMIFHDALSGRKKLVLKLHGCILELNDGKPFLTASSGNRHADAEVKTSSSKDTLTINAKGCRLALAYPETDFLQLDLHSSSIRHADAKSSGLLLDAQSSEGKASITGLNSASRINSRSSKLHLGLGYAAGNTGLSVESESGIVDIALRLPKGIGLQVSGADACTGLTNLPKSREGPHGNLKLSVRSDSGIIKIR